MWLSLKSGERRRLSLVDRQSIWPTPDGRDAEFVITTRARLAQEIVLSTPRVLRLRYRVETIRATMTIDQSEPALWPDADPVAGHTFEIMVTERGPLVVPSQGPRLANRHATWLGTVAEDVRSSWPSPPAQVREGSEWRVVPVVPGGLPPGTSRADVDVSYRLAALAEHDADVAVRFVVKVVLEGAHGTMTGEGGGEMSIHLDRESGVTRATRTGELQMFNAGRRVQVLRSSMELAAA